MEIADGANLLLNSLANRNLLFAATSVRRFCDQSLLVGWLVGWFVTLVVIYRKVGPQVQFGTHVQHPKSKTRRAY